MDYIPNEIVLHIIGYLRKKDVPKLRLVNTRFNLLAIPSVQKLFQVNFVRDSDIVKFVEVFENKSVVPFEKFAFGLVNRQPLEQFCVKFGNNVKFWQNFVIESSAIRGSRNSISQNTHILLKNCDKVEGIKYIVVAEKELGEVTGIPTLRNLKTITLTEDHPSRNENFFPLLDQIFQKAPNLRNVSIENCGTPIFVANILNQLYNINGNVHIQKFDMQLELPVMKIADLKKMVAISAQFTILDLQLYLPITHSHNEDENDNSEALTQAGEILSKWIEKLAPLRHLSLNHVDWRHGCCGNRIIAYDPLAIPLYSLANLQSLAIDNLATPFLPHVEFPVLTTLDCILYGDNEFSFSGCVFPNVKYAKLNLRREEDCEHWPLVLPNVEELYVWSETLKGILRFPKVKKLHIQVYTDEYTRFCDRKTLAKRCWNNLTGDAKYISDKRICNFKLETAKTSDAINSFLNLPQLTHLKFFEENIECWKAVIYASRLGQLRRLETLVFSDKYLKEKDEYCLELAKYHNFTIISDDYKLPPFLWAKANDIYSDEDDI